MPSSATHTGPSVSFSLKRPKKPNPTTTTNSRSNMPKKSRSLTFVPDEPLLTPKKINSNAKGRRNEDKTRKWLKKRGYSVQNTVRSSYRGKNDFFNCFDHIAVRKNLHEGPNDMLYLRPVVFVQTKSNVLGNAKKKLKNFVLEHNYGEVYLIVVWKDRKPKPTVYVWGTESFMQTFEGQSFRSVRLNWVKQDEHSPWFNIAYENATS